MPSLKDTFNSWINSIINSRINKQSKDKTFNPTVYSVFEQVQTKVNDDDTKYLSVEEQLAKTVQPKEKWLKYILYALQNFTKPLYTFTYTDYINKKSIIGRIRWSNSVEANENAKSVYNLPQEPEKTTLVKPVSRNFFQKVKADPGFLFKSWIDKWALWTFLIEYSSLMEDGISKRDAIDILKVDTIKDKSLIGFMEKLKTSNLALSVLMAQEWLFDDYTISIVESAESAWWDSKLYEWLTSLWESYRQEYEFRKKFISSFYYPGFLVILLIVVIFGILFFLLPVLAKLFKEIWGKKPLPDLMLQALDFKEHIFQYIWMLILYVVIFLIIKKILLSNSYLLGYWEKFKLRLPLIWQIRQLIEENRLFRILSQTLQSNLTEVQKIQSAERSTPSTLYKWVYRTMRNIYPRMRNLILTIEEANSQFGWDIYSKRMLSILRLATWDSRKVQKKYETFLAKNTQLLYDRLNVLNKIVTNVVILLVWLIVWWSFAFLFQMVMSMLQ